MASSAFTVGGGAAGEKYSIAASATVNAELVSTDGVRQVLWFVAGQDESGGTWTIATPTAFDTDVTAPAGEGKAILLGCKINNDDTTISYVLIYIAPEPLAVGETNQSSSTYGWIGKVNGAIRSTGGTTTDLTRIDLQAASVPGLPASTAEVWLNNHNGVLAVSTATGKGYIDANRFGGTTLSYVLGNVSDVTSARVECDVNNTRVRLAAPTVELKDANGINGLAVTTGAACAVTADAACTSVSVGQTAKGSAGAGAAWTLRAQQGNGNVGGALTIGGGLGGTPGTHKAGATTIDLGAAAGGASAELRVVADSARILTVEQLAASTQQISFGTSGGTDGGTVRGGPYLNLESATGPVQIIPSTGCSLFGNFVEVAGQLSSDTNDVAFSATPTLDCNLSNHHRIAAMTANITTLDMSNIRDGATYSVEVTQDGAGGWTIAWAAKFVFGDTYTNAPKATASSKTIWRFLSDGTNVRCIGKETF